LPIVNHFYFNTKKEEAKLQLEAQKKFEKLEKAHSKEEKERINAEKAEKSSMRR
jgi:hypothetical protein